MRARSANDERPKTHDSRLQKWLVPVAVVVAVFSLGRSIATFVPHDEPPRPAFAGEPRTAAASVRRSPAPAAAPLPLGWAHRGNFESLSDDTQAMRPALVGKRVVQTDLAAGTGRGQLFHQRIRREIRHRDSLRRAALRRPAAEAAATLRRQAKCLLGVARLQKRDPLSPEFLGLPYLEELA